MLSGGTVSLKGSRVSGSGQQSTVEYVLENPFSSGVLVEGAKLLHDQGAALGTLIEMMNDLKGTYAQWLANPRFVENGHEDKPSPHTKEYFLLKKALATGVSLLGSFDPTGGGVNVVQGGISTGAALIMWQKISSLFEQLITRRGMGSKAVVYANWYSYQVAKKAVPPGSLELRMRAIIKQKLWNATSGVGKVGTGGAGVAASTFLSPLFGGVVGYFVSSAGAYVGKKLDALFGQDIQTLAQGLHWNAFLEQVISRGRGKGPSTQILEVLWSELALGKTSGVTLHQIIPEPDGWLVIADLVG